VLHPVASAAVARDVVHQNTYRSIGCTPRMATTARTISFRSDVRRSRIPTPVSPSACSATRYDVRSTLKVSTVTRAEISVGWSMNTS
jgi:hypothetical protein